MRTLGLLMVALVFANAVLFGLRRSLSEERLVLVDVASARSREVSDARVLLEREQKLGALVAKARETTRAPRGIGELRDMLRGAEQGLPIDRLSLDFRPDERLPEGMGGGRVEASLQGPFDALYQYLERVEAMFLPLSPEHMSLRGDGSRVTLAVRWAARWPLQTTASAAHTELTALELSRLSQWLSRERRFALERNPFAFRPTAAASEPAPVAEASKLAPKVPLEKPNLDAGPERPVLKGFVLAHPELEPVVRRRVLAALSYAGEVRLLMVGDSIGEYRIDSMEARESVTLQHAETGEPLRLTLE